MKDRLTASERRLKMLDYITYKRQATYNELAEEFAVSRCTVWRDIVFISRFAPVYTKTGCYRGVYVLPTHRNTKYYLSDVEEILLNKLLEQVSEDDKKILKGIIIRFSRGVFSLSIRMS